MTLLVTHAPNDDESGFGYYRRLTAENGLSSWREVAGLAGVQRSRGALLGHAEFVAGELGLESASAQFASRQEAECRSWGRLHRVQTDAVCPACLDEPYLRHHWEHTYTTACPYHRIRLADRCDDCGELLSSNRYHIDQCDCGHELRLLAQTPATPAQLWLSTLIASAGKQSGGIAPDTRRIDVGILARVVQTLCLYSDPSQPTSPRRSAALPKTIAEAVDFLKPLEGLLAEWPAGFRSHVEMRIAAGRPDGRTLNTRLGPWYITLRKLCHGTALDPLVKVIMEVAAERFDGVLGLDSAKEMAEGATEYIRAPDAARAIGVSVDRLHKAMHAGECSYRPRRVGTRGQIYEIPRAEVARIQQRRAEWITADQACELAGVPPSVLGHMMAAGVVRSDVNWRHDILKGGQVEQCSVLELFERVRDAAEPVANPDDEKVMWSGFTSRRMGDRQAIQTLLQAINEGRVKAVARGRRIGDMAFRRADVASYFGTPLLEAGMSIQQLATLTSWKWESISHWIDLGLLESQSIVLRGQPCRVVLPHQLLTFRQTYVPLADLARAMGTKSSALSRSLPGVELVGAQSLSGGATRGGLVRLADLGRLSVIGAKVGNDLFVPASLMQ